MKKRLLKIAGILSALVLTFSVAVACGSNVQANADNANEYTEEIVEEGSAPAMSWIGLLTCGLANNRGCAGSVSGMGIVLGGCAIGALALIGKRKDD